MRYYSEPPAASVTEPSPSYRWAMLALVWALYFCFGMTVWSLAPLVGSITQDLAMNSSQMGVILGTWQLVYIFVAYPIGALVDRLGLRRSLALGMGAITLSLVLRSLAVDFFSLLAIVALFGIGGPMISTGAPKMASLWFQGRQRGLAAGIYTTGPPLGGVFVLASANSLIVPLTGHWRLSFLVYGAIAVLVGAAAWWRLARDREARPPSGTEGASPWPGLRPALASLLRVHNVRVVMLLAVVTFFVDHGLRNWLPTVFTDRGRSAVEAGFLASFAQGAGILGLLVIPGLVRHGYRRIAIAGLLLTSAVASTGIGLLNGPALGLALALAGIALSSFMPLLMLVLMETPEIGPARMGAAAGLFFTTAEVGGFSGPFLLGLLRDLTGSLFPGLVLLASLAGLFSLTGLMIREPRGRGAPTAPGGG